MTLMCEPEVSRALTHISNVFTSLGRGLLCLDEHFRIVHASASAKEMLGGATNGSVDGRPVCDILGKELFGPGAPLREALLAGERREGWRALIRPLSVSVAPLIAPSDLDPRIRYLVVIVPADEDHFSAASSPAVLSGLIARSAAMSRIFHLIENLQGSEAPVLLTGERGTGRHVVARTIHEHSPRRRGPFIVVTCSALPQELLESELFGHQRGAFAGAVRDRVGRFELAAQGTLYLDDVSELPAETQEKVMRVPFTPRIISASNVDLREAVASGAFRADLYDKLRVVPIDIPPLRARREDVEPLARLLLRRAAERHGRNLRLAPEVIRVFLNYSWPGNVKELESAIEYAVAVAKGPVIQPDDLPREVCGAETPAADAASIPESQRLRAALESHRWRREETARSLGISRATLWRRMRELGLL